MQTSELEKKNNKLTDEECINFRPSPNFKHMKKYLKSKLEERENSSPNLGSDPSTTPNYEEQESAKQTQTMAQRVNPPLPPNSPPPDSPLMVPKQEVVDEEYNDSTRTTVAVPEYKQSSKNDTPKPEKTMCRQFARGMCTRGGGCIYAHELILSQLPGVYTFCKNFQNAICTLPKCKFVHATVFEKEHFYRTGYLPPHTLAHLKESNSALAPPNALEGTPAEAAPIFSNPPPSLRPGVSALPTSGSAPAPDVTQMKHNSEGYSNSVALNRMGSPTKREWSDIDPGMPSEDYGEPSAKKCNKCPVTELKLQCQRSKMQTLLETKEAYAKQKAQLLKWDTKLNIVLERTVKQMREWGKHLKYGVEDIITQPSLERSMLDQLNLFVQLNSRLNEDTSQKLMLSQVLKFFKDRSSN